MPFIPPYAPYDPTDKACFSYETVLKRWPIIITGVIDHLHNVCHALSIEGTQLAADDEAGRARVQARVQEGTGIIEKISKLKYEMARDRALERILDDGSTDVELYNSELAVLEKENRNTWFTAPWLYAECYLYRLLRSFFVQTEGWKDADPFYEQKMKTFKHSSKSVIQLATMMQDLEAEKETIRSNPETLKVLFNEMIQMCLWGNATDLSLLTHLTEADIQNLQTVGKDAQTARQEFILKDDEEEVWNHVQTLQGGQVDFVLDNSGFELFTDLVFADFLVTCTPYVSKVVFHPKLIPWFVSDVTPPDFGATLAALADGALFAVADGVSPAQLANVCALGARWTALHAQGIFALSVDTGTPLGGGASGAGAPAAFWTTARPYWDMRTEAPGTFGLLVASDLVVFKGDLNYRKLTGDVRWPAWTPFKEAIGPLAGAFPLLSLRTNKADVVTGVPRETAEALDASGEKWRVDGRYALVSFVPRD